MGDTGSIEYSVVSVVPSPVTPTDDPVSYLFRYIGQVLGVAFSSAILQSVLQKDLTRLITGPDAESVSPPSS